MSGDDPVPIGGRALDILIVLAERAGQVVSKRELFDRVWPGVMVDEANLRVNLASLRKVLGDGRGGARYISNVPGRGYCFVAPLARQPLPGVASQPVARSVSAVGLPPLLTRMVGRNETVTALSALLKSRRFVSIVGPGGIGKTTVAVAVGHSLRTELNDQVCFADLGALNDPALVAGAVCSALGCPVHMEDPTQDLLAFLADKQMLLILDNCEHLIETAADLAARLFREATGLHLLTTSREALRVDGENVHLILPLEGPRDEVGLTARQALTLPAVQLFMERAAASGHRVPLTDADAPTVARICRRLDGIALAIELVASRAGVYGIRGTADLLDSRFKLHWQGQRSALPRHRTLQAMLNWSYDLLSDHERTVLRRLSVFVGYFLLKSALHVAGDDRGSDASDVTLAVASLVDRSLLWTSERGGSMFYRLPDTTRLYAAGKLAQSGEADTILRRHAEHFADLLDVSAAGVMTPGSRELSASEPHLGNIRAALEWCFSAAGEVTVGTELTARSAPLFLGLSLLNESERWCRRALAALPQADRGSKREMMLQHALAAASLFVHGATREVRVAIERSLDLAEKLGEVERQLHLYAGLGMFQSMSGDTRAAVETAERCTIVADGFGTAAAAIMARWLLASAHFVAGNQAEAQRHGERAMALSFASGSSDFRFFGYDQRLRGLVSLALTLWLRGSPLHALEMAQQAIDEATSHAAPADVGIVFTNAPLVFLWAGDLDLAQERIEWTIAYATKYSLRISIARALGLKGALLVARGEPAAGVDLLRHALQTLQAVQPVATMFLLPALAQGLLRCGAPDQAEAAIDNALRMRTGIETYPYPEVLRMKAEVLLAMPEPDLTAAEDWLLRSLERARAQSSLGWELRTATTLARLWAAQGRAADGYDLLRAVSSQFREGFETSDLATAAQLLAELEESIPPGSAPT